MAKKITLAQIHVPDPTRDCQERNLLNQECINRLWCEAASQEQVRLASILSEFAGLRFRVERPCPLKKKGKHIDTEPYKVVIETTWDESLFETDDADGIAQVLSIGIHPEFLSYVHPRLPDTYYLKCRTRDEQAA